MAKGMPEVELDGWNFPPKQVPIACWFALWKAGGRLEAKMEVGPMSDSATRIRLMEEIKSAGFKLPKSAFREGAKYTRFGGGTHKLQIDENGIPDDSPDYVKGVARSLWEKLWKEGRKITEVLEGFDWEGAGA